MILLEVTTFSWLDVAYKLATVTIALFNVFYIIYINRSKNKDTAAQRAAERRIDLLKTIVLQPNLNKMYEFLDELWAELEKLKLGDIDNKNTQSENVVKMQIEPIIQDKFNQFRSDFIIALNATAPALGEKVKEISDNMRDTLLSNMADEGINLWVTSYFNDRIKSVFEKGKKDLINALFNYDGNE